MKTNIGSARIKDLETEGSISYVGENSASIVSTGTATYIYRNFAIKSGETYTVNFKAKNNSGGDGSVTWDYPYPGNSKNKIEIEGDDWKDYELSYTVPLVVSNDEYIRMAIGQLGTSSGDIDISDVKISITNSMLPFARVYGMALLSISAGYASVNSNFSSIGIANSGLSTVSDKMTITLPTTCDTDGLHANPIIMVQFTHDGSSGNLEARSGNYDNTTGTFDVKFYLGGAHTDISSYTGLYLWIQAFGI